MSALKLFHSPTSPFVRKVMVVLHETGQLEDVALIAAAGNPLAPGTMPLAHNPLGKIPALERADGCTIYDSRVICRFFDDRASAGLYPLGPRGWEAITLEATSDGIMEAAILMVYEVRVRPAEHSSPDWIEAQHAKIARSLDALEERWLAYLAGPLCIGQIALGCALEYLDLRQPERNWRQDRDGLAAWAAAFKTRSSMLQTVPIG
jgi:glutathione S-transferase